MNCGCFIKEMCRNMHIVVSTKRSGEYTASTTPPSQRDEGWGLTWVTLDTPKSHEQRKNKLYKVRASIHK